MTLEEKYCRGCTAFPNSTCYVRSAGVMHTCPCVNCMVKVLCDNACKEFADLLHKSFAKLKSEGLMDGWDIKDDENTM